VRLLTTTIGPRTWTRMSMDGDRSPWMPSHYMLSLGPRAVLAGEGELVVYRHKVRVVAVGFGRRSLVRGLSSWCIRSRSRLPINTHAKCMINAALDNDDRAERGTATEMERDHKSHPKMPFRNVSVLSPRHLSDKIQKRYFVEKRDPYSRSS
jgi:hypothetical protein